MLVGRGIYIYRQMGDNMSIGKILMIVGAILLPVTAIYIGAGQTMGVPTPIGIAGYIRYANGTIIPEETVVWAENLNTQERVWRKTQDGRFAIPISARTGDKIKVWTQYKGMQASKIIEVDLHKVTHWANLSLGYVEKEPISPYWLLLIPLGMIGGGYAIDKRRNHH